MAKPRPNFFIVGAPKAGTTAMYEFLAEHPQVFMPKVKEPHFFSTDLASPLAIRDQREYLDLFRDARGEKEIGEGSTGYLQSRVAPGAIKAFAPDARIIVMLRNPIDVMYSWHNEEIVCMEEDLTDFGQALAAEEARRASLPASGSNCLSRLLYHDVVDFPAQIGRYIEQFGRNSIHVIIHDDFLRDGEGVYRETCRFLGLDEDFLPDFRQVNTTRSVRNRRFQKLLYSPPPAVRKLGKWLMPRQARDTIRSMNTKEIRREPIPT